MELIKNTINKIVDIVNVKENSVLGETEKDYKKYMKEELEKIFIKQSDIPEGLLNKNFNNFYTTAQNSPIKEDIMIQSQKDCRKTGMGLYLWSKITGNGKTHLATAYCIEQIKKFHVRAQYYSSTEFSLNTGARI